MHSLTELEKIFEKALVDQIRQVGNYRKIEAGAHLIEPGQVLDQIPLVLSGLIKVSRIDDEGREVFLYYVNSQESCAMTFTCCMEHHESEIRATAEEEVEVILLPGYLMDEWMNKFSSWKKFVMQTIHLRFNELLKTLDQIAFQKLDERVVHFLMEKSKATDSTLINLSHEQIAQDLATSRVVISRLLKKLELDKRVLLYRNQIKLLQAFYEL
ncbi:MAG: Crp/Fnr family transcriptional regulator [Saprospiraceae bacterium]|nr:Crp/Fnr family transcriptional regulator [Saprospiraceae bacterium]